MVEKICTKNFITMATFKTMLWTYDKLKDGSYPIKLRVTIGNQQKYIALGLYAKPEQWDDKSSQFVSNKSINPRYKELNKQLDDYITRRKEVVRDFELQKTDWTISQFEDAFLHRGKRGKVKEYFQSLIDSLQSTGRIGNAKCYSSTLKILELYDKNFSKRVFTEIDFSYVKKFDEWLQKPRETVYVSSKGNKKSVHREGCSGNTRKYYLKALRAVINKAITDKEAERKSYPFGEDGFDIASLEKETAKRYLPAEYLKIIKTTQAKTEKCEFARKLFLLSYYCYGMSFIDMALLTKKNLVRLDNGTYIRYVRHKVKNAKNPKEIQIRITDEISNLMEALVKIQTAIDPYLIPIVSKQGYAGEKLYDHIRARYKRYSVNLVALADELGLKDVNLTSYVSRHTMAMTLQNNEVSREVISQILGHKELKTTNTYLDSFNTEIIDEASKVL
jgi:integrase